MFERQEFAGYREFDAITYWVRRSLHVEVEVDRGHYAVAEFLLE
jgi:hypothetical protein